MVDETVVNLPKFLHSFLAQLLSVLANDADADQHKKSYVCLEISP